RRTSAAIAPAWRGTTAVLAPAPKHWTLTDSRVAVRRLRESFTRSCGCAALTGANGPDRMPSCDMPSEARTPSAACRRSAHGRGVHHGLEPLAGMHLDQPVGKRDQVDREQRKVVLPTD